MSIPTNEFNFPLIAFNLLNEDKFGEILRLASEEDCSDIYFKSNQKIAVKKHGKKFYVSERHVREDEMMMLINQVAFAGAYERVSNGKKLDLAYRLTKDSNKDDMVYRINTGSFNGNRGVVMTVRAVRSTPPTSKEVYIPQPIVDANLAGRNGLGIFVGETGSGKSTSAAGLIVDILTKTDDHVLTLENPIEMSFDSVSGARTDCTQYQVGKDVDDFVKGIESALRENPDFIFVGECRGVGTMDAALTAAETGHSVLTTLHVARGFLVFHRVVSMFEPKQRSYIKTRLADLLNYICYQVLCTGSDGKRLALREYLVLDSECRNKLLDCDFDQISSVMYNLFKDKGKLLSDDIHEKFIEGLISEQTYRSLASTFEVDMDVVSGHIAKEYVKA